MARTVLPKIETWTFPDSGGWCLIRDQAVGADRVYVLAPKASGVSGYGRISLHSIDSSGEVNASLLMRDGNGHEFHEFVVLEGWDPSTYKLAGDEFVRRLDPGGNLPPQGGATA